MRDCRRAYVVVRAVEMRCSREGHVIRETIPSWYRKKYGNSAENEPYAVREKTTEFVGAATIFPYARRFS